MGVSGLDLHSNSPEPVNFFGAQSSLGGHNFRLRGTSSQTRRHGGHTGAVPPQLTACAPPKRKLCPPKRGLCPEEIDRFGALERKSRPKLVILVDLKLEKPLEIPISAGKSLEISVKTFFFWRSPLFGRKIPLNFRTTPCSFDLDRDKFLVPLSNSHKIDFSCPPKFISAPQSRYLGAGPASSPLGGERPRNAPRGAGPDAA